MASGLFKHLASHLALKTESTSRPRTEYSTPSNVYQKRTLVTTEFAKIFEIAIKFACLLNFILYGRTSSHRLLHFWLNVKLKKTPIEHLHHHRHCNTDDIFQNHFSLRPPHTHWREILGRTLNSVKTGTSK